MNTQRDEILRDSKYRRMIPGVADARPGVASVLSWAWHGLALRA